MIQLLIKDLRITRKFIGLGVLFIGFFFFALGALEGIPLAVPAVIFAHFLTVTATKMDEKNNNGLMLASLPVNRRELVTSRYVSLLLFVALAFAVTSVWRLLGVQVLPADEVPGFRLVPSILLVAGIALYYSLYLPLYFGLGAKLSQVLDLIVLFVLSGVGLLSVRVLELTRISDRLHTLSSVDGLTLALICIGGALILLGLSWCISVYLYERRNY